MALADYTYRLMAQSGDSTPHDELGTSDDLSGGTISLVDVGSGDYFWQFAGQALANGPSKVVTGGNNGSGATIAIRYAVTNYGGTDFAFLIGYVTSSSVAEGINVGRTTANVQRFRWATVVAGSPTTINTSIRTAVIRASTLAATNSDIVEVWLDQGARSGDTPDIVMTGQNFSTTTLSRIAISNTGVTVRVADFVVWGEELSDADCAALADDGIRTTLAPPAVPPTAPTGVTAGSVTALSATCSWTDASGDETGFKVQYAPSPYSSWTTLSGSPTAANATSLATGNVLASGTTYKFRVASTNANGDSAWVESNEFTTVGVGSGRMLLLGVG